MYDNILTLIKISPLRIEWFLFVKPWDTYTQRFFVLKLVEIGRKVLREEDFKLGQRIFAISSVEKDMALHLKKLETPSPKIAWCQVWSKSV